MALLSSEKASIYKKNCNCKLLSVSHFKSQCDKIARQQAKDRWQQHTDESQKRKDEREEKTRAWQERQAMKDALNVPMASECSHLHRFTAEESKQLKKIKDELWLHDEAEKTEKLARSWEQIRLLRNEQQRREQLEKSQLLAMERAGYKPCVCREFNNSGSCSFGARCCFSHEKEVCRQFKMHGICSFGDFCRYSHEGASALRSAPRSAPQAEKKQPEAEQKKPHADTTVQIQVDDTAFPALGADCKDASRQQAPQKQAPQKQASQKQAVPCSAPQVE